MTDNARNLQLWTERALMQEVGHRMHSLHTPEHLDNKGIKLSNTVVPDADTVLYYTVTEELQSEHDS